MSFIIVEKETGEVMSNEVIATAAMPEKEVEKLLVETYRNEDKTTLIVYELGSPRSFTQTVKATVKVK
jgi:predicted Fe-Mo cluster-binding NifX family protein